MKRSHSTVASPTGQRIPAFSEGYRPDDYFGRYDLQTELMTRVRGQERRRMLREALDAGEIDAVPVPPRTGADESLSRKGAVAVAYRRQLCR